MQNENKKSYMKYIGISILIVIIAIILFVVFSLPDDSNNGAYSSKCGVCYRTFTDNSNCRSISKTGMCKQCYENFKYATGRSDITEFGIFAYQTDFDLLCYSKKRQSI